MIEQPERRRDSTTGVNTIEKHPEAVRYRQLILAEQWAHLEGEPAPQRQEVSDPTAMARHIKDFALEAGASLVGICEMTQDHVYKGREVPEKYAIVMAWEMDYDTVTYGTPPETFVEGFRGYYQLGGACVKLAQRIRSMGYPARVHHPMGAGRIVVVPYAVAAGLGEQGRCGVLVTREFGARMRLACVSTDLPLALDNPVNIGVAKHCQQCHLCERACPALIVPATRSVQRGIERWVVKDADACREFMHGKQWCVSCIKVCPFNDLSRGGRFPAAPKVEATATNV